MSDPLRHAMAQARLDAMANKAIADKSDVRGRKASLEALAKNGATEGERAAAKNRLDALLAKHPELKTEAPKVDPVPVPPAPSTNTRPRTILDDLNDFFREHGRPWVYARPQPQPLSDLEKTMRAMPWFFSMLEARAHRTQERWANAHGDLNHEMVQAMLQELELETLATLEREATFANTNTGREIRAQVVRELQRRAARHQDRYDVPKVSSIHRQPGFDNPGTMGWGTRYEPHDIPATRAPKDETWVIQNHAITVRIRGDVYEPVTAKVTLHSNSTPRYDRMGCISGYDAGRPTATFVVVVRSDGRDFYNAPCEVTFEGDTWEGVVGFSAGATFVELHIAAEKKPKPTGLGFSYYDKTTGKKRWICRCGTSREVLLRGPNQCQDCGERVYNEPWESPPKAPDPPKGNWCDGSFSTGRVVGAAAENSVPMPDGTHEVGVDIGATRTAPHISVAFKPQNTRNVARERKQHIRMRPARRRQP